MLLASICVGVTGPATAETVRCSVFIVDPEIPGRPRDERLLLRKRIRTREVVGDIGMEATTTVDAWLFGVDPKEKPTYTVTVSGTDPKAVNNDLLVISRGLEEVDWWSVYRLGTGQHL